MTRRVLIVTHGGRPEAVVALHEAVKELQDAGFEVGLHDDDLAETFGDHMAQLRTREGVAESEVVMVLGGDGTILRAAELTHGTGVPLLGVNLGHVGFLAEAEREGLHAAVQRLAAHDYVVEERGVLEVRVTLPGEDEPRVGWALNEATVEKASRERMIEVAIGVDGRPLSSFGCDGVVMSTATGSTAHAFSAGGPIVWPDVDAMLLVPLAAHALFARPLVVGPSSTFALELLQRSAGPGVLTCDGRRRIDLPAGSRVEVRRGDSPIRLARLSTAPFTDRLVSKFSLPVVGWRGRVAEDAAEAARVARQAATAAVDAAKRPDGGHPTAPDPKGE
ncbi:MULTISPECIES: NAD kinase [Oerskovia]|uniref:NAD kinase n=1 Tax=Oerskovia enterophila TaxID=43678 RepID=A0A163QHF2_9CELL|nr:MULTISPECIES: NAD kinase [Oerskovia]KRC32420.1 NAD kinase [Oerskovia sp. Root22]KRD45993.1 NAD kinase [Oerskovia sp. Root918]KZM34173.1 NAD kinase [Oerskovia enterophila]OCI30194.1 NAD kinase [Oerskovia enterophila]